MAFDANRADLCIGVIGTGAMGRGIVQVAAAGGINVVMMDTREGAAEEAREFVAKMLSRAAEKGSISKADADSATARIRVARSLAEFRDCHMIVEAIIENLDAKRALFGELEGIVGPECILATNTSSMSVTTIAAKLKTPQRFAGFHFFNPVPLMKLVEVIDGLLTENWVSEALMVIGRRMTREPVRLTDAPGFLVNQVGRGFTLEASHLVYEGIASFADVDRVMRDVGGFRMGPFELMDLIGNDVNYAVTAAVWEAFFYDPRYKPSFTQKRLVEAGRLGRKSGKGYYDYAPGALPPEPVKSRESGEEIFFRILAMLINEAAEAVFWQIASVEDIDLAMTKGVNYPKGLLLWADEIGLDKVLEKMRRLQDEYGEDRYRPGMLLKRMAREGRRFYQ